MTEPVIIYTQEPEGKCPVQAEGTINGREFYFRSRGSGWALHIAGLSGDAIASDRWHHYEDYPGTDYEEPTNLHGHLCYFSAGWAESAECKAFIERAAKLWLAANPS